MDLQKLVAPLLAEFVASGPERWYQTTAPKLAFSPGTSLPLSLMPLLANAFPSLELPEEGRLVNAKTKRTVMQKFGAPGGALLFIRNGCLFARKAEGEAEATVVKACTSLCGKKGTPFECVGKGGRNCAVRIGGFVGLLDWKGSAHIITDKQVGGAEDFAFAFPRIFPGWQEVSYTTPKAFLLGIGAVAFGSAAYDVVREITKR